VHCASVQNNDALPGPSKTSQQVPGQSSTDGQVLTRRAQKRASVSPAIKVTTASTSKATNLSRSDVSITDYENSHKSEDDTSSDDN